MNRNDVDAAHSQFFRCEPADSVDMPAKFLLPHNGFRRLEKLFHSHPSRRQISLHIENKDDRLILFPHIPHSTERGLLYAIRMCQEEEDITFVNNRPRDCCISLSLIPTYARRINDAKVVPLVRSDVARRALTAFSYRVAVALRNGLADRTLAGHRPSKQRHRELLQAVSFLAQ